MKRVKQILIILVVFLGIGIAALIAIPIIYKEEIVQAIKDIANEELEAKVDFAGIELSLFKHFPDLAVDIHDLAIEGIDQFESVELFSATSSIIDIDLMSLFKKDQIGTIKSIQLDSPIVNLLIEEDGAENFAITKSSDEPDSETRYEIDLSSFKIINGRFIYKDRLSEISTVLDGINIVGQGALRGEDYDLDYDGNISESTISASGINYLNRVKTDIKGSTKIDMEQSKYEFDSNQLILNDLRINVSGWVQNLSSSLLMDVNFSSPDSEFKRLWSLVPAVYTSDFPDAAITGSMSVDGYFRGTYDDSRSQLPSFQLDLKAKDGAVKYPGAGEKLEAINASVVIESPGDMDQMKIDASHFEFTLADNPIKGRFAIRNVVSNPAIDMLLKGKLDLERLSSVVNTADNAELSGALECDIQVKGKMSDIENKAYQNTLISGFINIANLKYTQDNEPPIFLNELKSDFTPSKLNIHTISGQIGKTDINAEAEIQNIIALLTPGKEVKGFFKCSSNLIDFNEWMPENNESADSLSSTFDLPTKFELNVDAQANQILYGDYVLNDAQIKGTFNDGDLTIERLSSEVGQSDLLVSGKLKNVLGYAMNGEMLTGGISVKSKLLDLNQFMNEDEAVAGAEEKLEPFLIPDNVDIIINADLQKVLYDNLDLKNVVGSISLSNNEARIETMNAEALDGQFALSGGYATKKDSKPHFDFEYTLQKFDFRKTFDKVNTFRILAPIAQFIEGNFNSRISMSGDLGEGLLPDFKTLNVKGFVETFNSILQGFKPLEILDQYFSESVLKRMQLTDTKNNFTVENGTVTIKEFEKKIENINLKISGTHSLNQEINYIIKSKIPKEKLARTGVTEIVDQGLKSVNTQLNKLGFNIQNGEYVNINFILTGTINNPKVDVRVVGMDGQTDITDAVKGEIKEAVATVKDSIKTTVKGKLDTLESRVVQEKDKILDSASILANQKIDSIRSDVKKQVDSLVKEKIGGAIPDSLKVKIDSILLKGGGKEVDKVKDILKDINPFKKKKSGNIGM